MTDAATIAADPTWIPHRIDTSTRQVEFFHLGREMLGATGFIADRNPPPPDRAMLSWDEVMAIQPATGRLHFIFHTAFCRSTLLVRAVNRPGVAAVLNEPFIIASMVNAGDAGAPLIKPLLGLLARPWQEGEAVIVKPTNHSNMLMPTLLQQWPEARAVLMSNDLPAFLRSVARKGMRGRIWARKLFIELQTYAAMNFGLNELESFALTDMQCAGLAWFLNQRYFNAHLQGHVTGVSSDRLRMLDGDRFNDAREATIAGLFEHFGISAPAGTAAELANSEVFESHSKLGGAYDGDHDNEDAVPAEEIAKVGEWVGMIAQQAGLTVPLEHSLF